MQRDFYRRGVDCRDSGSHEGGDKHHTTACVQFGANVNFAVVSIGKIVASDLFHRIGLGLRWTCRGDEGPAEDFGEEILIRFVDGSE